MIELRVLGDLGLRHREDGREIRSVLTQRKRVAVLAYLALQPEGRYVSRDTLLGLFWPEASEERARHALSQTLYVLRRGLGRGVVESRGHQDVRVDPDALWCDAVAFEERLADGDREGALELYRGPLLDGVHVRASPRFEKWAEGKRRELHEKAVAAAGELADGLAEEDRTDEALGWARRAAQLAPLDEAGARRLVRLLASRGHQTAAREVCRGYVERIRTELELEPSPEIVRLADELAAPPEPEEERPSRGRGRRDEAAEADGRRPPPEGSDADGRPPWVPGHRTAAVLSAITVAALIVGVAAIGVGIAGPGPSGPADTSPSVAVLPFESGDRGAGHDPFARSVHGELLSELTRVRGLTVIAPPSVRRAGRDGESVSEIGRELDADAVLSGETRGEGDDLRLRVRLVEPGSGRVLWTEEYDRPRSVEEYTRLETEVTAGVSSALRARLSPGDRALVGWPPTGSLLAYEEYLRGQEQLLRFHAHAQRPAYVDRAADLFGRAIRRDSSFAGAHAGLARAFASRYHLTKERRWLDSAYASARRARMLVPNLAETHLALGYTHWAADSNRIALEHVRRAVERKPSSYFATLWMVTLHDNLNQYDQGVRWARRLVRLDPTRPASLYAMAWELRAVGLYDAADAWARRTLELAPDYRRAVEFRAFLRALEGDPEAGLRMLEAFLELYPSEALAMLDAATLALMADRPSEALAYYRRARETFEATRPAGSPSRPDGVPPPKARAYAEMLAGDAEWGRAALRSASERIRKRGEAGLSHGQHFDLAAVHAALGETDVAIDHLEASYTKGRRNLWWMEIYPLLDSVREEPRYQALAETMRRDLARMRDSVEAMEIDVYPGT